MLATLKISHWNTSIISSVRITHTEVAEGEGSHTPFPK